MAELVTLPLPDPYGSLTAVEHVDPETGRVRYVVSGRRISGVFVVEPEIDREEPVPSRVYVRYGNGLDDCGHYRDEDRTDRPVVNGIELIGGVILNPDTATPSGRWRLDIRRAAGPYTSTRVPDKTAEYTTAVIAAILARWGSLPVRDELMLAAARRTAERRIADLHHYDLQPRYRRRDDLAAEIDRYEDLVAQLRALAEQDPVPHGYGFS